jgi:hypothetical protein
VVILSDSAGQVRRFEEVIADLSLSPHTRTPRSQAAQLSGGTY